MWAGAVYAILAVCGAGLIWIYVPLMVRDFALGEGLTGATRFHIAEAKCRQVIAFCHIKAVEFPGGEGHEIALDYVFIDLLPGDRSVRLLEKPSNPAVVTTDLGQRTLWNRALTLAALLVFLFYYVPRMIRRGLRE